MSEDGMTKIKQNKVKFSATVSARIKKKAVEYGNTPDYGSLSNFVESAMNYYLGAIEKEDDMRIQSLEEDLRAAEAEIERINVERGNASVVLLKLLKTHPELIDDVNKLMKTSTGNKNYTKKVSFK